MNKSTKKRGIIIVFLIAILFFTGIGTILINVAPKNAEDNIYMTIGDKKITKEEYQVYYMLYVNEFVNTYGIYFSSWGLDVNKDFNMQKYDKENTWEDVFKTQTNNSIKQYVALNKDAAATKTKIDVSKQVDELIEIFKNNAKTENTDLKTYLINVFGPDVTEEDVRKAVSYQYSAIDYSNKLNDMLKDTITEKDLVELYTKYPATFDKVVYRMMTFEKGDDAEKAKETANTFLESITDEDSFIEKAKEYSDSDTLFESVGTKNTKTEDIASFIFADERKLGDNALLEGDDAYYVLFFKSRNICEDKTIDFRHIYFNTNGASQEEKTQLESKAKALFSTIKSKENLTEDDFSSYAFVYSDDTLTRNNGGLMDGIAKGDTDKALEDWLFADRKKGDIEILETDIGFHIVYFSAENEVYWKMAAKKYLVKELYNEYLNKLLAKYDAKDTNN